MILDLAHQTQIPLQDLNEETVMDILPVQGKLPDWLEGTLIRNGPAKFDFGEQRISHWFDGLAVLHAFTFGQGKLSYRSKFLRSDAYHRSMENGDLRFMGFAQDPCKSIFKRLFSHFLPSMTPEIVQNANVNIMRFAQDYVALTETPLPVRFDPGTLQTLGVLNFQDSLCKKDCFESAHPHYDKTRKEFINYQIELGASCRYSLYTISDKEPVIRKPFFSMKSDKASYMHTFALTEHYVIMVEFPLVLNPLDLLLKGGGYITQFKWEPQRSTRFHVIDRTHGILMKSLETEAFFCFHHVNAYEELDTIVIDLVRYPDAQIVFGDPLPEQKRRLERFRLNVNRSSLSSTTIVETLLELPRINYQQYNASPYRYSYGVGFKYPATKSDCIPIIKINVSNSQMLEWKEPGSLAGEPVFVPYPNAKEEDDGVLLSVVINELKNCSFLLILDAKDLHEIARSNPIPLIPYGLHGMFFHA
jgi:carotenoid cleavage dioxygenase-like enzyme